MSGSQLCFMYSCDANYAEFIIPFMYFSSLSNMGAAYEFLLTERVSDGLKGRVSSLANALGAEVTLRQAPARPSGVALHRGAAAPL